MNWEYVLRDTARILLFLLCVAALFARPKADWSVPCDSVRDALKRRRAKP